MVFLMFSHVQGFSHNITAYHFERLSDVVDELAQGFTDAYTSITDSESAYSAAADSLRAAVGDIPLRLDRITQSLNGYIRASAGLPDSELKGLADDLFRGLNESLALGNVAIATALPVSWGWPLL